MDLRSSIGLEILPQESFFFRQDVKPAKVITCIYEDCWENNSYNQKSQYCDLHQKIIKNYTAELFQKISQKINESDWQELLKKLQLTKNIISLDKLAVLVHQYSGYLLTVKDKEFIYEVYKSLYDEKGRLVREDQAYKRKSNIDTLS